MNIGSNKPGLCCPFNVQVNMSYKLFHMHRYLLILLDSALNTVGENVEYTKKKKYVARMSHCVFSTNPLKTLPRIFFLN